MRFHWPILALLALAGCAAPAPRTPPASAERPIRALVEQGLANLGAGKVDVAAAAFNAVLKRDPADAFAHLAVAGTYEIQGRDGDRMARELARIGYRQALHFDPNNAWAAYRLGVAALEEGNSREALDLLAQAAPRHAHAHWALNALAAAAYAEGRIELAQAAINLAQRTAGDSLAIARNAAIIAAAAGHAEEAERRFTGIASRLSPGMRHVVGDRIRQWRLRPAALDTGGSPESNVEVEKGTAQVQDKGLAPATRAPFFAREAVNQGSDSNDMARATMMMPIPRPAPDARARMVQIDVVLIRTEEIEASRRGLNLLEGLQIQFGNSDTATRTRTVPDDGGTTFQRVVTRSISIPAITYSLNIANDESDRADVLARPTLVALDGQPANFFSGEEVSIPVTGNFSSSLVDKRIGIELAVTPTFLDDDTVLLSVSASRGFVNLASNVPAHALRTTQQRVTTAVAVDFGQTLIMSGLSESQTSRMRSGVPLLQDVPLLGSVFSEDWKQTFAKSVLILLTPRRAGMAQLSGSAASRSHATTQLQRLERHLRELASDSGAHAAARQLHGNPFFRPPDRRDMDLGEDVRDDPARMAEALRSELSY